MLPKLSKKHCQSLSNKRLVWEQLETKWSWRQSILTAVNQLRKIQCKSALHRKYSNSLWQAKSDWHLMLLARLSQSSRPSSSCNSISSSWVRLKMERKIAQVWLPRTPSSWLQQARTIAIIKGSWLESSLQLSHQRQQTAHAAEISRNKTKRLSSCSMLPSWAVILPSA